LLSVFLCVIYAHENREFWYDELKIGTWNTMQQPWFAQYEDEIVSHIANNDLDVLNLDEEWTEYYKDRIVNHPEIKKKFPYYYYPANRQGVAGCNFTDSGLYNISYEFIGCLVETGVNTTTVIEPVPALSYYCQLAAIGIGLYNYDTVANMPCLACLVNVMQNLPSGVDAFGALSVCGQGNGPQYAYKGNSGKLILSKYPIEDIKVVNFNAWEAMRNNIHATINNFRIGFGYFAYNVLEDADPLLAGFMIGDLQPQQGQDFIDSGVDVCLGDFNSGPGYQPEVCYLLGNNSFTDIFYDNPAPTCCPPSHAAFPVCVGQVSFQSDHIFVNDKSRIRVSHRKYFNQSPLMSDHIGISATLRKPWFSEGLLAKAKTLEDKAKKQ